VGFEGFLTPLRQPLIAVPPAPTPGLALLETPIASKLAPTSSTSAFCRSELARDIEAERAWVSQERARDIKAEQAWVLQERACSRYQAAAYSSSFT
jgi:hypothetical protein